MAQVIFYEKPGCISNARQKKLLRNAGHNVVAIDLLKTDWNRNLLLNYFNNIPVPLWFNKSSPKIKSGEIEPDKLTPEKALQLILKDPILIRRPLLKVDNQYKVGFDFTEVDQWIGLNTGIDDADKDMNAVSDLESCSRNDTKAESATTGEQYHE